MVLVLAVALLAASHAAEAITCGHVASSLRPCIPYVIGKEPLAVACCSGGEEPEERGGNSGRPQDYLQRHQVDDDRHEGCPARSRFGPPRQVRRQHPLSHQQLYRLLEGELRFV
ncbi:Plant lipid transfer protein/Par allergen [Canna indica]|uniref:Plant lipid transfer protein/Par allergen n=1 Tax=Canna indica TaxID=4628 RepID=A0AAQ3KBI3_9LILI|nr:Plant lipid transfer protein/Par allergen [Canna indica]